ncbi:MAG TPA: alpha/beta hydrolase-fold protein, partial [Anaeromyxobacter sp.]|nr:alpha/beta hydrolase-fold protein [Anaeromyxobacter sp.]
MNGKLVELEVDSAALAGNPLGDPARRLVLAYLPPGAQAPLPAVYFLHGFSGSARGWTNVSMFSPTVPERIDALVASGELPPFLAAFPDGTTALGGTQWTNAPAVGRYQDYVAGDVVRAVEARLGTIPRREARAVVGKSSGAYGALCMGRDRPDVFSLLGVHS